MDSGSSTSSQKLRLFLPAAAVQAEPVAADVLKEATGMQVDTTDMDTVMLVVAV
jgi:hypothetical protein